MEKLPGRQHRCGEGTAHYNLVLNQGLLCYHSCLVKAHAHWQHSARSTTHTTTTTASSYSHKQSSLQPTKTTALPPPLNPKQHHHGNAPCYTSRSVQSAGPGARCGSSGTSAASATAAQTPATIISTEKSKQTYETHDSRNCKQRRAHTRIQA